MVKKGEEMARALGELQPLLLKLLTQRAVDRLPEIIWALGELGTTEAVGLLIDLFYESSFRYSLYIGLALDRIGGSKVRAFIKDNLESGQAMRQRMACYMLRKTQDRELLPYIRTLLVHPNCKIRNSARIAFQRLTSDKDPKSAS